MEVRKLQNKQVHRGELFYCDLGTTLGSEQGGIRPVLILQNDVGNRFSPTTIVAPLTTKLGKAILPTHVLIKKQQGLTSDSIILLEQIRTIDKNRLRGYVGTLDRDAMNEIGRAVEISMGIGGGCNGK